MEITTKITLDMLTYDSVSVLTQNTTTENAVEKQIGENIRTAYMNTQQSRDILKASLPTEYYNAICSLWGSSPKISHNNAESVT